MPEDSKERRQDGRLFECRSIMRSATAATGAHTASLLLHILHVIHIALHVLALEERHIEFSETPVELQAEELRVPSPQHFLGVKAGLCEHVIDAGPQNVAHAQCKRRHLALQELE